VVVKDYFAEHFISSFAYLNQLSSFYLLKPLCGKRLRQELQAKLK